LTDLLRYRALQEHAGKGVQYELNNRVNKLRNR
jgi:hypothetical protein